MDRREAEDRHAWQRVGSKQGKTDKTPMLSLVNAVSREVRSQVLPRVTANTLREAISEHVNAAASELHTDSAQYYLQAPSLWNRSCGIVGSPDVATNPTEVNGAAALVVSLAARRPLVRRRS